MGEINIKMMLCAVMNGTIEDYHRMALVHYPDFTCNHIKTRPITTIEANMGQISEDRDIVTKNQIRLEPFGYGNRTIGYVGRCPSCNRIYYMEVK
ncbi:MAG: hypothetical protein N3B21_19470 [Clostridia bacterium]|nr:hypothetical protein [Clostridia bacterium]